MARLAFRGQYGRLYCNGLAGGEKAVSAHNIVAEIATMSRTAPSLEHFSFLLRQLCLTGTDTTQRVAAI
jgi:hypothetical protein